MRISDWSSDVCSSDLGSSKTTGDRPAWRDRSTSAGVLVDPDRPQSRSSVRSGNDRISISTWLHPCTPEPITTAVVTFAGARWRMARDDRSEEHTSELQSLMRISYAVFCLKKKTTQEKNQNKST